MRQESGPKFGSLKLLGLGILMLILAVSCKQFNDDPAEPEQKIRMNVGKLQQQVGYSSQVTIQAPEESSASTPVKGMILGAMVVTSRETPYSTEVALNDEIKKNMEDELTNSIEFLGIIKLPNAEQFLEFKVPPETAGKWQIIAVGVDFAIETLDELGEDEHENALIYVGFSKNFYKAEDVGDEPLEEELVLQRACLTNISKGCATYSDNIEKDPVVQAAVEIIGVQINDIDVSDNFPLIVRVSPQNSQITATQAITNLKSYRDSFSGGTGAIDSLTILTTHTKNTNESSACKALADGAPTVTALTEACETQKYKLSIIK